jgi:hypothetical protein
MLAAAVFCLCLVGVANAQPGAAERAAVRAVTDAAKEWRLDSFEVGWDKGPVVRGSFVRDNGPGGTDSRSSASERTQREHTPRDNSPTDRAPREYTPRERDRCTGGGRWDR